MHIQIGDITLHSRNAKSACVNLSMASGKARDAVRTTFGYFMKRIVNCYNKHQPEYCFGRVSIKPYPFVLLKECIVKGKDLAWYTKGCRFSLKHLHLALSKPLIQDLSGETEPLTDDGIIV